MNGWVGVISSWIKQLAGQEVQYFIICPNSRMSQLAIGKETWTNHLPGFVYSFLKTTSHWVSSNILGHNHGHGNGRCKPLWWETEEPNPISIEIKRSETISTGMCAMLCHVRQPEGTSTDHYIAVIAIRGRYHPVQERHPRGIASLHQQIFAEDGLHPHWLWSPQLIQPWKKSE